MENVQVEQGQEQTGLFASSKQPDIHKLKYDPETKVNYNPETLEIINIKTGNPTGEIFKQETKTAEPKQSEKKSGRKTTGKKEPKEPDIEVRSTRDADLYIAELLINGKIPEVNQYSVPIPKLDFFGTPIKASIKSKIPFWQSKTVQKDLLYYITQTCNISRKQAAKKLDKLVKLNQHIVLITKPTIKKEEHEIKFETWLEKNGMWNTILTIDDQEFPLVDHKESLQVIDESRDKACFFDRLNSVLEIEAKASRKILYAINKQAQEIEAFVEIEELYEEKREAENKRRKEVELERMEAEANRRSEEGADKNQLKLHGCLIPQSYRIDGRSACGKIYHITYNNQGEPKTEQITNCLLVTTGYYTSVDSNADMVELKFMAPDVGTGAWRTIECNLSFRTKEGFKKDLIPAGISTEPRKIEAVIEYLNKCIVENLNAREEGHPTEFKQGSVYERNGIKDNYLNYVSGNRIFVRNGGVYDQQSCIYIDVENTKSNKKLVITRDINKWIESVRPVIIYPRIRYACYKTFDIILTKKLNSKPSTLGFECKSGSGKSLTLMIASSQIGNPHEAQGLIISGDTSIPSLIADFRSYIDHPMFVDESTNMSDKVRKVIGYFATNGQEPPRAKQDGKKRDLVPLNSNLIIASENPILSEYAPDGADARTTIITNPPLPVLEDSVIRRAKAGICENYGHILPLFLNKMLQHEDKLKEWYEEAITRLQTTTKEVRMKRKADYFAGAEVAGRLLEEVYQEIGLETLNPADVVNQIWQETTLSRQNDTLAIRALKYIHSFYLENSRNFVIGNQLPTERTDKIFGWDFDEYIDFNTEVLKNALIKAGYDKPVAILRQWRDLEIIQTDKPDKMVKTDSHYTKVGQGKKSMTVYRVMKDKIDEYVIGADGLKAIEEEEDRELEKIANECLKFIPKPEPVRSFAELHVNPNIQN